MRTVTTATAMCLLLAACNWKPQPPPPPPVAPAPPRLAALRIHVANATEDAAKRAGEDVCANTLYLRQAVQRALVRAGYALVVDAEAPRDLAVEITADWPWDKPGAAAMTLRDGAGNPIEQLSGLVGFDENHDIDEASAVALVTAISRSAKLARFAAAPPAPSPTVVAKPAPQIDRERVLAAARELCRAMLAGDAEAVARASALPIEIWDVTDVNLGDPIRERRVLRTTGELMAFRPCKELVGLDPSAGPDTLSSLDAKPVGGGAWEVSTEIGQVEAILVLAPRGDRLVLTGYREQ